MKSSRGKQVAIAMLLLGLPVAVLGALAVWGHLEREARLQEIRSLAVPIFERCESLTHVRDDIDREAVGAIDLGREFLERWPDGSQADAVRPALLRLLQMRRGRYQRELERQRVGMTAITERMDAYGEELVRLSEGVLRSRGSPFSDRDLAYRVVLDARLRAGSFRRVRELANAFLAEGPDDAGRRHAHRAVVRSYDGEERFREAAEYARSRASERGERDDRVFYDALRLDALRQLCDLDGIRSLMEEVQAAYPARGMALGDSAFAERHQDLLERSDYWLWLVHLTQSRYDLARRHLLTWIENQDVESPSTHLARHVEFLERFAGRSPSSDIDAVWATDDRVSLRESVGNVVLILFRETRDTWGTTLLEELDRRSRRESGERLVTVVLSPVEDGVDAPRFERELERVQGHLHDLGIGLPWGLVSEGEAARLSPLTSTGSCVVIDRDGKSAWLASLRCGVRHWNWKLAQVVLDDLLGRSGASHGPGAP